MKGRLKLWLFGAMSLVGLILFVLFVGNIINVEVGLQILALVSSMFLLCCGMSGLISMYIKKKKPKFHDRVIVEQSDERNVFIKNKTGYKVGQIISWMNTMLCLIFAICAKGLPLWVIFCQAGVTISYPILWCVIYNKYYNE